MIVKWDRREREINCFDRETISVHDIGILDVASNFIKVISDEKDDEITDVIDVKGEEGEEDEEVNSIVVEDEEGEKNNFIVMKDEEGGNVNAKNFDFFACFVRTCTWSLMLLSNLSLQRLQMYLCFLSFFNEAFFSIVRCCFFCRIFCCSYCFIIRFVFVFFARMNQVHLWWFSLRWCHS